MRKLAQSHYSGALMQLLGWPVAVSPVHNLTNKKHRRVPVSHWWAPWDSNPQPID